MNDRDVISINAIRIAISHCVPSSVAKRLSFKGEDKMKPSPRINVTKIQPIKANRKQTSKTSHIIPYGENNKIYRTNE